MVNPSKAKGTAWESAVVAYLAEHGFPYAERRALSGSLDRGDIAGIPGVVVECKNEKEIRLSRYMDEVAVEVANDGAEYGVAVVKRRGRPTQAAYVVMTLGSFCELVREDVSRAGPDDLIVFGSRRGLQLHRPRGVS